MGSLHGIPDTERASEWFLKGQVSVKTVVTLLKKPDYSRL
jgi:hypothetical protein